MTVNRCVPGADLESRRRLSPGSRFWPAVVHVAPPLLPDGRVDVYGLCSLWDDAVNAGLNPQEADRG